MYPTLAMAIYSRPIIDTAKVDTVSLDSVKNEALRNRSVHESSVLDSKYTPNNLIALPNSLCYNPSQIYMRTLSKTLVHTTPLH